MFDRFVPVSLKTVLEGPIYTTTEVIYGIFVELIVIFILFFVRSLPNTSKKTSPLYPCIK